MANYPFTTINANRGISHVRTECPCLQRDRRCDSENCHNGKRYVPIELLDVAGLVPGAHKGKGLGNQFLDELSNADAILNIIDASGGTNTEGEPVEVGTHDPLEEVEFIQNELNHWLADIIERNWDGIERQSRSPSFDIDDALMELLSSFGATQPQIQETLREIEYPENPREWSDSDYQRLAANLRAKAKPIVIVANKADVAPEENIERLLQLDKHVIPATAQGELALRKGTEQGYLSYDPGDDEFDIIDDISDDQRQTLASLANLLTKWNGTGVQASLNEAVYSELDQITVYPVQDETHWTDSDDNMLPDAFLLPNGATPKELAYAIHSDIGDGYLHAIDAKTNRQIPDDYSLEEGDVIKIVSTAT